MKHEVKTETDHVRVTMEGEIDLHVAPEFRSILKQASNTRPPLLVVDLTGVPFIDSSGIATIVEALKNARKWSGALRVENCTEAVRDTFEIAGLTAILGIV